MSARGCTWGALFAACAACGYAPVRSKPPHAVRVAAVRNDTAQAEAGGIFADAFRSELHGRRQLDPEGASSTELQLEVIALRVTPSSSAGDGAASFRLDAELKMNVGDYEDRFHAGEDFLAGVDVLGTEANRRAALRRLARTAARDAIERYDVGERLR